MTTIFMVHPPFVIVSLCAVNVQGHALAERSTLSEVRTVRLNYRAERTDGD
jgi:hypothetical protein